MSKSKCSICNLPNIDQVNAAILAGSTLEEISLIAGKKIARSTLFRHKEHMAVEAASLPPLANVDGPETEKLPDIASPNLDAAGARLVAVLKLAQAADRAGWIAEKTNSIKALSVQGELLSKFLAHSANLDWTASE